MKILTFKNLFFLILAIFSLFKIFIFTIKYESAFLKIQNFYYYNSVFSIITIKY